MAGIAAAITAPEEKETPDQGGRADKKSDQFPKDKLSGRKREAATIESARLEWPDERSARRAMRDEWMDDVQSAFSADIGVLRLLWWIFRCFNIDEHLYAWPTNAFLVEKTGAKQTIIDDALRRIRLAGWIQSEKTDKRNAAGEIVGSYRKIYLSRPVTDSRTNRETVATDSRTDRPPTPAPGGDRVPHPPVTESRTDRDQFPDNRFPDRDSLTKNPEKKPPSGGTSFELNEEQLSDVERFASDAEPVESMMDRTGFDRRRCINTLVKMIVIKCACTQFYDSDPEAEYELLARDEKEAWRSAARAEVERLDSIRRGDF